MLPHEKDVDALAFSNDPKHTAGSVTDFFNSKKIGLLDPFLTNFLPNLIPLSPTSLRTLHKSCRLNVSSLPSSQWKRLPNQLLIILLQFNFYRKVLSFCTRTQYL